MSDRHVRLLEMVARRSRLELAAHDRSRDTLDPASAARRTDLAERAKQTGVRVAAARARRYRALGA